MPEQPDDGKGAGGAANETARTNEQAQQVSGQASEQAPQQAPKPAPEQAQQAPDQVQQAPQVPEQASQPQQGPQQPQQSQQPQQARAVHPVWQAPQHAGRATQQPGWATLIRPADPAPVRAATLWGILATALAAAFLLGDGLGAGLLITAVPAALAAYAAARAAGRKARPWTLAWAVGCLALLAIPALRDAGWPAVLALFAAIGLGALALYGSRTWPGVLLSPLGFFDAAPTGVVWAWAGLRAGGQGSRERWWPVVRAAGVGLVLLVLFGALFASADAAFADLLGALTPDVSVEDGPLRILFFLLGGLVAVAAARAAAAPLRWDRIKIAPGTPRSPVEWALPLVVLNLLFAGFIAVQLAVLFGGYDKVLESTGLSYAEYARQGFWQLLWATLLTLVVIALALRWAPRSGPGDRRLVRAVLGALCVLTLVVVASALRRMDLYVDAYGLTRLRLSVATMELWLGLVIVLIIAAGVFGGRWLPRAVVASAGAVVLAFGLASPDGLIAERNVSRFQEAAESDRDQGKAIDLAYFQTLSADAVPALDRLPEPHRSCALRGINEALADRGQKPWYATSLGEHRAKKILRDRPVTTSYEVCSRLGAFGSRYEY
ncbi:DUF4173 domain-containing protein [Streptomyces venezuelae]|uniref:DUF4173 domain-containing protein n=1 Tax=Streptomyces venezuelae TaxID=54571 RepID=A0A5P2D005_STRVZ|nr:DUF4173 domain-containing protein [Streptomyces venezuelae]QES47860.1 DUF4173 domain-containing protein [Streptomyces venezuelae]